ncbi:MAG TPA: ATP-dependent DNA ligase [Longimicrobium sp.]|nr:ATP-dependent DNA ligase [Longimicrobium sp.]
MALPIEPGYPPMEAETAAKLPTGDEWQYEPKYDGFRCLAFRDGDEVELRSKAGKPLGRYFPDVVESLRALRAKRFILDGEIVVPVGDALSFEELQLRLHPAASRVAKLAAAHPAVFVAFDLLLAPRGGPLTGLPLAERRKKLEAFAEQFFAPGGPVRLSRSTRAVAEARRWLKGELAGLDGVMAKRIDEPYRSGEREGMLKIKNLRTAECVVGGFRYAQKEPIVGSLLLGLYGDDGLLHHVGFCSAIPREERAELTPKLEKLVEPPGFTGAAPGGPSRWSTERSTQWEPLAPRLVVEVQYDHFSGGRFRHGTRLLRWRPDKSPRQCTMDQVTQKKADLMKLLG